MGIVGKLLGAAGSTFVYICVATTVAETIIVASLWRSGAFETTKMQKYAAVVYGFDITELNLGGNKAKPTDPIASMTRDQLLDSRVKSNPTLLTRQEAIRKGADDIRALVQALSTKRERYEIVKRGFDDLLVKLEDDVDSSALTEVRRTLEVLQPKQSKDLMIEMLQDGDVDPEDNVLEDVLAMIRGMPQDKLRKIFTEFKTEEERIVLNNILLAIGELDTQ
ncbi:MAG: hypothetical protein KDB05_11815 [Planctomycetales bacterium]|nr:hypothetical protein [Planctomycetales bacterium]